MDMPNMAYNMYECKYQVFKAKIKVFSIHFPLYKANTTIILVYLYTC